MPKRLLVARRRMPYQLRNALDWTMLVAMVVALILMGKGAFSACQPDKLELIASSFAPVTLKDFRVEPRILTVGSDGTLWDGLCNISDETVRWTHELAIRPTERSPLASTPTRIIISKTPDNEPRVLNAHECLPDHYTGPVTSIIPPGQWELVLLVTVTGSRMGEVQQINRVSPPFEVRPAP